MFCSGCRLWGFQAEIQMGIIVGTWARDLSWEIGTERLPTIAATKLGKLAYKSAVKIAVKTGDNFA